jgi:transposase
VRVRRYPSDTTDAEWRLIEPLLPIAACETPSGGRPEAHERRAIVDAIRYLVDNGCKWRALPADFPPWRTVYGVFARWHRGGVLARIRDELVRAVRLAAGYCPLPVAAVIDSQTVRAAETVARSSRGYDAAKRANGRKRSVAVDLGGMLLTTLVTSAGVQDRDIARELLARLRAERPVVPSVIWADGAYRGTLVPWAAEHLRFRIEIVSRPPGVSGFVVLPRRWVVERSLAWLSHARRLVRDYERLPEHSEALLTWAFVTLMARRLAEAR